MPRTSEEEYHFKICLSSVCVVPNCTWKLPSNPSKLLTQTTFSCTWCMIKPAPSGYWAPRVTVRLHLSFSFVDFNVHTSSVIVSQLSLYFDWLKSCVPSCRHAIACIIRCHWKGSTQKVSGDRMCILFERFAMDVCQWLVLRVLTLKKKH